MKFIVLSCNKITQDIKKYIIKYWFKIFEVFDIVVLSQQTAKLCDKEVIKIQLNVQSLTFILTFATAVSIFILWTRISPPHNSCHQIIRNTILEKRQHPVPTQTKVQNGVTLKTVQDGHHTECNSTFKQTFFRRSWKFWVPKAAGNWRRCSCCWVSCTEQETTGK